MLPKVFFNKNYVILFSGMTISKLGMWFFTIAIPLIVYDLTHSPSKMAFVLALELGAQVIFSLIGGALADQMSKKKIMIIGDYASALFVLVVPILFLSGYNSIIVIYIAAFTLSALAAFHHPSFESAVPEILSKEDLIQGNSFFRLSETIITFLGPAVAGIAIALFGNSNVLLITSVAFFLSGTIFLFLKFRDFAEEEKKRPELVKPIVEGLRYVFGTKIILVGSLVIFGINIGFGAVESLFMYYLKDYLGLSPINIGLIFSLQAIGPILAVYFASKFKHIPRGNVIIYSGIVIGLAQMLLYFSQFSLVILVFCQIFIKGSVTLLAINWFTLRQETVPSKLLGRVISSTRMVAFLALPFSAMIAGFLAESINVLSIFLVAGAFAIVSSILGVSLGLFDRKRLDKIQNDTAL
ncbi:MFS transporter [Bacillus thuringiensis]|uniref:MFS transporter n=1 Tax=Bacillus thuringiensis TaxID=1428 RepID=A0A9X6V789_BACTU|nr:MFS transporter [Bacillus thuringiensis]MCU5281731.1 MFS transporter [Bacillus cereus]AMR83362.1 MFS transporter [Bacillus thuringiensis]KIP22806.1 major Facilitator Superfamily protein [Bacillus thuringiensis serovar morrisoni]MBG9639436.1 MFS transporter [Bacillus thuringiensis]MBG9671477.1 MFS transporter [Bacillus thuringiensis]